MKLDFLPSLATEDLVQFRDAIAESLTQVEAELKNRDVLDVCMCTPGYVLGADGKCRKHDGAPLGPFTVMLCEECDTDREVDTYTADGTITFRVCGHVQERDS